MWDGLLMLLFLSLIMGAASFAAGALPLSFSLSSRQLRLITALGTGVLVGTSLIVIIPEGVETLYSAGTPSHAHNNERSWSLVTRGVEINTKRSVPMEHVEVDTRHAIPLEHSEALHPGYIRQTSDDAHEPSRTGPDDGYDEVGGASDDTSMESGDSAAHSDFEPHAWIGISLILGFILMYLIDTLPQTASSSSQPQRFHISLNQFSFNRSASVSNENAETPTADTFANRATSHDSAYRSRPSSTTVGLVIHAAADGIALGASSTSGSKLSFIIFIALMIHKAPAAFGLTSVLLKQGLSKRMARAHLIVFSLAAPLGALLTWSAVHLLGYSSDSLGDSASTEFATGVLLLFSGGTFLYVAMHTMQEAGTTDHSHGSEHGMNGYAGVPLDDPYAASVPTPSKPQGRALVDTLVTVAGMLLPLLTQWGHAH